MLRYAMILSIPIEAFFASFLCANNFHKGLTGKRLLQTFPFLRRVTNKAHRFVFTCLKLAIKIVGVSRICCFFKVAEQSFGAVSSVVKKQNKQFNMN